MEEIKTMKPTLTEMEYVKKILEYNVKLSPEPQGQRMHNGMEQYWRGVSVPVSGFVGLNRANRRALERRKR